MPSTRTQVVGAYYQNEEDGYPPVVLCMTCCWDEQVLQGEARAAGASRRMAWAGGAPAGAGCLGEQVSADPQRMRGWLGGLLLVA